MTDDEWPDPPLADRRDGRRLRVRLAFAAVFFVAFVALSWEYAFEVVGHRWPPQGSFSRWFTLLVLQLMGYVVLPLLLGGYVGDVVYDRFIGE